MTGWVIRDAAADDRAAWRRLWDAYLSYYGVDLAPAVTAATWARLLDPACALKARVADSDGALLGFAIHQHHPSSWVAGDDCYLEDLFVAQEARGRGTGRALIEDLVARARSRGWHRLYWHTHETNARARALYDSFTPSDGHIRYRLAL